MAKIEAADFLQRMRRVLPAGARYALHEPQFGATDKAYVMECLDSGWVSSVGQFVDRFERELAEFTGAAHAVAVVNGTAALHVALQLAGVGPGDEVLLPSLTFIATANAVRYCGATPHFVDSEEATLGLDPDRLETWLREIAEPAAGGWRNRHTGARLAAVLPMHTFGHPVRLDALVALCARWNLPLVEDAAESLGSWYGERHTGRFGRLGTLSFNGNKTITTGGGGAILTDDAQLAARAKHLTTTARVPAGWNFVHDEVGYNYRLPNLNAALGCAQMQRLPQALAAKRALAERYRAAFADFPALRFVAEPAGTRSNYWLCALLLDEADMDLRDALLTATNDAGMMTRPAWTLMHRLPMFRDCPRMPLPVAESLEARLLNLPSSPQLEGLAR